MIPMSSTLVTTGKKNSFLTGRNLQQSSGRGGWLEEDNMKTHCGREPEVDITDD